MKLDFFKQVKDSFNNSEIKEFISELANHLTGNKEKTINNLPNKERETTRSTSIIDEIEKKYNLSYNSSLKLRERRNEILQEYAKSMDENNKLYYVTYKYNGKDTYLISQYDKEGKETKSVVATKELPHNIEKDIILKVENNKFVKDEEITKNIIDKVIEQAEQISKEQIVELNNFREEGCLYYVVEGKTNRVYLQRLDNNITCEEVNLPQDIKNVVSAGFVLKYRNGEYHIEKELTDKSLKN